LALLHPRVDEFDHRDEERLALIIPIHLVKGKAPVLLQRPAAQRVQIYAAPQLQ
jgi:hypothetical protein